MNGNLRRKVWKEKYKLFCFYKVFYKVHFGCLLLSIIWMEVKPQPYTPLNFT